MFSSRAFADQEPAFPLGRADTRAPGAGGNEMCPTKPDQRASEEFQIAFHGKRANFCCPQCAAKFQQHARPHWARLPQYSPFLSMNWPDPDVDHDGNRIRMNDVYRETALLAGRAAIAITVFLIPLAALAGVARFKSNRALAYSAV